MYNNNPFSSLLRCWFRFIDGGFCIFTGSQQLDNFKLYINTRMPSIKFSLVHSQHSISFFDVPVNKLDQLETRVHRKKQIATVC